MSGKKTYRFKKSFGPAGSTAGIIIFAGSVIVFIPGLLYPGVGLIIVFFIMMMGALFGFTHECTMVDYQNKRVKNGSCVLGIFPSGKWIPVKQGMKLVIAKSNETYTAHSRSNRTINTKVEQKRIILLNPKGRSIAPLKDVNKSSAPKEELKEMSERLDVPVYSRKKSA